ncbi:LysE/ArgO family amino acid transporter [Paenibacillus lautus]|uniref:LysE/ArgO family amino acid transporter n=1 Tax=Paenibacillus TaxID=44249 RepID=UPI000BBDDA7D|nr:MULTISPECIES: LysE/ArgO family amino acid transporter [Paenibacillus]MBY0162216.1 amino acid transporter [Cytobacillus firmus]PCL95000.1 lysine transporter LysE [Paenibacillus lautus]QOT12814.1 amino acid transporter [Paenibacillus sp. JNUCC-32]GIP02590.1 LysE/yggA protein [Paenibacillus lautus]
MIGVILHGFILAIGLILPLGVQNVFVFNQGVVQPRFIRALPVIITASLCDTLLISLAVLGVSVIVLEYEWIKLTLFTLGICFLVYMGAATWRSKPSGQDPESARSFSPKKQIVFAMSVSLLNPHAVLDTMGVIGTSSLQYEGADKVIFTVICIAVSWLWFLGLGIAGRAAGRMDPSGRLLFALNRISAVIMWGTAAYLVFHLIQT